jgi:hypothetical protein
MSSKAKELQINDDYLLIVYERVKVYFEREHQLRAKKTHGMLIKKFDLSRQKHYRYLGLGKKTYSRNFNNALQFSKTLLSLSSQRALIKKYNIFDTYPQRLSPGRF